MSLQHIVLFSFPRELSEDEAADMRAMVASWPSEIGLMTKCRFGTDLTGARTRGYGYLLYTEFPDVAALEEYRAHPVHQRFFDWLVERDCTPLAFDFYLDEDTVLMPERPAPAPLSAAPRRRLRRGDRATPPGILKWTPYVAVVWLVIGLAVLARLRARRPGSVAMIGSILGEEGGTDAAILDR